jgi:glycosyltransferase involved in cell wall biosynthesis
MRVLTFNWHEAYLCLLAKTGHQWEIVERRKGGTSTWFYETRPVPANARLVTEGTARDRLRRGGYDVVVCHNLHDALLVHEYEVARVLVFHNKLTTELALGGNQVDRATVLAEYRRLLDASPGFLLVFISPSKQEDWGLEGTVIRPGIDLAEYGGYEGSEARALRIGNFMRDRDLMLGYSIQRAVLGGRPSTLLGLNEGEADGRFTRSWDDLKACLRSHRFLLSTTVHPFEDGYNLATLEAMATGMPVVSLDNPTSPVRDGVNGYISNDLDYLRDRIDLLFRDRELARALGAAARHTVEVEFPIDRFTAAWNCVLESASARQRGRRPAVTQRVRGSDAGSLAMPGRRRVLLAYVSYPATTARYIEASLRRRHDVVTVGPVIDESLVRAWNLQNLKEQARPHDVPCELDTDLVAIAARLADSFEPELFLWVESVPGFLPRNIPRIGCPTACYLIDTHLHTAAHFEWAARFDWVFLAQREYVELFRSNGLPRVTWLPLACDPTVHAPGAVAKRYDIGFVGSITAAHARRAALLARLAGRFDVHIERSFLHEMAATLAASRVVFNNAVNNDLNMRVFEAMCSGAFLLTDRAPGSGLQEMFLDRVHLAYYDDDEIEEVADYYLSHPEEREQIAARGRQEVLRWHTYDHRVESLLRQVFDGPESVGLDPRSFVRPSDRVAQAALDLRAAGWPGEAAAVADLVRGHREVDDVTRWVLGHGALSGRDAAAVAMLASL